MNSMNSLYSTSRIIYRLTLNEENTTWSCMNISSILKRLLRNALTSLISSTIMVKTELRENQKFPMYRQCILYERRLYQVYIC